MTGHAPENRLDWLQKGEFSKEDLPDLAKYEDRLDWLRPILDKPERMDEALTLRRWRYDIPRFAGTTKPPSAFSASGHENDEDFLEMGFSRLYAHYRVACFDYHGFIRSSRRRWNSPARTQECLENIREAKRRLEHIEHVLRMQHLMEWQHELHRQEHLRLQRQLEREHQRDYGMER